ncbi:VOC family protein [Maribacter sp. BPC-D8]|uniref:bleomycin resistance protein n=1 Tax=Maribacter sp. BPC-D8 TaxID=3053613 RepID=UPI002B46E675|nr:VOC family protein [Maribacter sp. BPC-D8]WRI28751.1 VOC family protein [Maribacter sp. BPC-D8]
MLISINPKLPMRNRNVTIDYYVNSLGFKKVGAIDYPEYLMIEKDDIEIHFFLFEALNPKEYYGQVYIRTNDIDTLYQSLLNANITIHPNGKLTMKPWKQKEFSLLDPDNNLLTFGESFNQ